MSLCRGAALGGVATHVYVCDGESFPVTDYLVSLEIWYPHTKFLGKYGILLGNLVPLTFSELSYSLPQGLAMRD